MPGLKINPQSIAVLNDEILRISAIIMEKFRWKFNKIVDFSRVLRMGYSEYMRFRIWYLHYEYIF